jgi:hypothetical protein
VLNGFVELDDGRVIPYAMSAIEPLIKGRRYGKFAIDPDAYID